ncbi:MAG: alkaline phosphatase family protein [Planctomycetes bacterium]|nr:alkaline phosphatase family protein [Planctomycetota bacterium]
MKGFRRGFLLLFLMFAPLIGLEHLECLLAAGDESDGPKIRLAVIVVFDQMRGDYLEKWKDLFEGGGFKRLQQDGAWFTNCHYPYSDTLTAPGHASLVTGTSPYKHGIIANSWYDRASGEIVGAVESERYHIVPQLPAKNDKNATNTTKELGASPLRRCEESIGDVIFRRSKGRAKIVSLSIKDRAAILLAALRAQFVYWFSTLRGGFVTSSYYQDDLPGWVRDFNKRKLPDTWFGKDWTRIREDRDYAKFSGPDNVSFEGIGIAQGRTFPHPMKGGLQQIGQNYYEALTFSPRGSELLLDFAKTAIDAEKLGKNEVTDLLCLSFSSNDLIGHCWGPDSQEVLDITLRSDRLMKELLDTLDAKVGKGRYVIAVSADHGICPIPEVAKSQGKDAGRVDPELLKSQAVAHLQETFARNKKTLPWIEATAGQWVYLNRGVLRELGLEQKVVERELADWLVKQPGIQDAFTRSQLQSKEGQGPLVESVRKSFFPEASGDVRVLLKPHHLFSNPPKSSRSEYYLTTHGSPHPYDTHVPLLVMGPGIQPGVKSERVTPQTLTTILAKSLSLSLPSAAEAPLPKGLFR